MLILASSSPRRQALIDCLGVNVQCRPSTVDESLLSTNGTVDDFVTRAALAKADDVAGAHDHAVVIGCDTVVVHAGRQLGKPGDRVDAEATLRAMAGDLVEIKTGLALASNRPHERYRSTAVVSGACRMAAFDDVTLERYLASGIWHDKAGSLAIQHQDPSLIETMDGCIPNALGLPLCRLSTMLLDAPIGLDERAVLSRFDCGPDRSACPVTIGTLAGT